MVPPVVRDPASNPIAGAFDMCARIGQQVVGSVINTTSTMSSQVGNGINKAAETAGKILYYYYYIIIYILYYYYYYKYFILLLLLYSFLYKIIISITSI